MLAQMKTRTDLHLPRKVFHFTCVLIIFLCMVLLPEKINWLIYLVFGVPAVMLDLARQTSSAINRWTISIGGPLLRKTEIKQLSGASYAIVAIGLVYFVFPYPYAHLSVLFLAVGDPIASFFGIIYGKRKLIGKKSLEGFMAAFVFCSLAAFIFFKLSFPNSHYSGLVSALCGLIAAFSELTPVGSLDDNLTQPLLSASTMTLLFYLWESPV